MSKPKWLRSEEELLTTPRSSLVFATTDETLARNILNHKSLAVYGRHCSVRAFQDRPPVTQCWNCWRLDHPTHQCKDPQRCRLCSELHDEKDHKATDPMNCNKCTAAHESGDTMEMDTTDDGRCPHETRCHNCLGNNNVPHDHPADARRCPARLEKYSTARENERRAQKSDNPWIKVKGKKLKQKVPHPTGKTNPTPSSNRFIANTSTPEVPNHSKQTQQ